MIFNLIFDHIYVLNLKNSVDRKIHIQNEFKRVGIEKYEFFEATPFDSNEVNNLMNSGFVKKFPNCFRCNNKRCNCENNYLTPFQIGNWCSFINIFNDIIKNDYKFVLICEDDIVFTFQYKKIIYSLLSAQNFKKNKIKMNQPLLIRMGTAFNPYNHNNTTDKPRFLKNYSLCNPCFAINKELAIIYLKHLKIIDYHSDVYFHQKIPKNVKGVQYFTMYPYPVYELSFVKSKQKFESLVRPLNSCRRKEYKEFLFLSSNVFLNIFLRSIIKITHLNILSEGIGYNGSIDYFILLNENEKNKYYFENKILLVDNYYDDIKIIYYNILSNNKNSIKIYNLYVNKINELYNINLNIVNNDNLLKSIVIFYKYYLKILNKDNVIKIDINISDDINIFLKYFNILDKDTINKAIINYKLYKNKIIDMITSNNRLALTYEPIINNSITSNDIVIKNTETLIFNNKIIDIFCITNIDIDNYFFSL
jgi:GR25 family glycosyltransferase involved in LPS biosynthesis